MTLKVPCAYVAALLFIVPRSLADPAGASAEIPCPFNPLCLCRLNRAPGTQIDEHISATWHQSTGGGRWAGSIDRRGKHHDISDDDDDDDVSEVHVNISDVSCVGVPFASVPVLPRSQITHVDMVNTGIEHIDWPNEQHGSDFKIPAQIDSIRFMGNRILYISESSFRSMANDLKSLDLSFNELDEIPLRAVHMLRTLDWANFHGNQIASLEGLGTLWSDWSPTLRALFLGGNEITVLEKTRYDVWRGEASEHRHSLSALRNLYWLNVDGNLLTGLAPESLPPQLHTLSAANNRLTQFPHRALETLRNLSGLDLRGNCIDRLPTAGLGTGDGHDADRSLNGSPKFRLDKLDLGENLISKLPENGSALFNGTVHIRDLYLDYNRINRLPDSAFRGTFVSRLHLAANGITTIDDRAFSSLSSTLVYLDLNRNKLQKIPRALNYLKRLRFLHLAANQLKKLHRQDLANFGHHLQVLSLNENQLEQFPWAALSNSTNLVELNLAYNQIENVTGAMFHHWAHDLEVLNLKGNQIVQLPARLFRFAPKLRELNLSFNKLIHASEEALIDVADSLEKLELNMAVGSSRTVSFPVASLIKQLHQLKWLSLDYNRLTTLPSTVFDHYQHLVYLSLEGNRFRQLSSSSGPLVLTSGKLRSLKVLKLAHNHFEALASRTFHSYRELTSVALDYNRIQFIESRSFDHLPKLRHVWLGHNRIEYLEEKSFRWLPSLVELDLQSNRLREFSLDAISNCTNGAAPAKLNISNNLIHQLSSTEEVQPLYFSVIDASHNLLGSLPGKEFFGSLAPKSLHRLLLHHNRIDNIQDGVLSVGCRRLQVLDVSHNRIKWIARDAFFGANSIQMVLANDNAIDQLPGGTFANLRKLRVVDLAANRLRTVPSDLFANTAVEALNLAHNHLTSMPSGCLTSISSTLADLNLSHNEIEHVDSIILSTVPRLVTLNLAHNRLTVLPDNLFSHLNHLLTLDLSFNAIRANFKELFHELQHVKKLNLAGVGLVRWPSMPLPKLVCLNLSSNGLEFRNTEHTPNAVLRLTSLRSLDLSHNRLASVPSFLWSAAPLLKQVDLSFNAIKQITRDSFAGLTRLQTLIMRPLPLLETIESDSFQHVPLLSKLAMQTWPGHHLANLLTGLQGLKSLSIDVRGSVLSSLHFDSLGNVDVAPKLRELDITGNQLRIVYGDVFSNINIHSSPECSVSLKHTSIKYLPNGLTSGFAGCTSMVLDLSHNALHTFGNQALRENTTATSAIPVNFLGELRLEGNSLICSCEIRWLGKWFKQWHIEKESAIAPTMMRSFSASASSIYEAFCRDPISNRKHPLTDLVNIENTCAHSGVSSRSLCESIHISYAIIFAFLIAVTNVRWQL